MEKTALDISNYISSLNNFLYKLLFFNFIINIFLYYLPSINLATIIYISVEIYFIARIFKIYKTFIPILFSQMLVIFLANLTYLTFIISYSLNKFLFDFSMEFVFEHFLYCEPKTYFLANAYLNLFAFSIIFFNNLIPKSLIVKVVEKISLVELNFSKRNIFILISGCLFFELIFYSSDILGMQSTGGFILENDKSTWYTHLYFFVVNFHLVLNILFLLSFKKENITSYMILFLILSFSSNFVFSILFQRKDILNFFITNFFIYFVLTDQKIITFKKLLVYLFSFIIIFQAWTFLSAIRSQSLTGEKMTLKEIVEEGKIFSFYTDPYVNKYGKNQAARNLSTRLLNNQELASIFHYNSLSENRYLNGQLLFSYIIKVIPQAIYPKKTEHLTGEDLIRKATSSPIYHKDTLLSFQSSSYIDFGLFGLFIYPVIINLLIFIYYKTIALRLLSNFSGIYILSLVIPLITLRITETSFIEWFVILRDIFIFILIFNYLFSFTQKKEIIKS